VYFEQVLIHVRSKVNRVLSILFIGTRMQAVNWSNLELKLFLIALGFMACFPVLPNYRLEGFLAPQREGNNSRWFHVTILFF
jgi:hypothetical protein